MDFSFKKNTSDKPERVHKHTNIWVYIIQKKQNASKI